VVPTFNIKNEHSDDIDLKSIFEAYEKIIEVRKLFADNQQYSVFSQISSVVRQEIQAVMQMLSLWDVTEDAQRIEEKINRVLSVANTSYDYLIKFQTINQNSESVSSPMFDGNNKLSLNRICEALACTLRVAKSKLLFSLQFALQIGTSQKAALLRKKCLAQWRLISKIKQEFTDQIVFICFAPEIVK
jgi:hypothetical protein